MSLWQKIRGTVENIFQIGLGGPQLKNNAGTVEARNAGDSAFAVVRGADPVGMNDLVNKRYADTLNKPIVIAAQFDGNNALPANSAVEKFYIVTTTGVNAAIGQLIFDDGSNAGTATVLAALEGRTVFTSQAFTGGTISLGANTFYVWDANTTQWLREADPAAIGAVRVIRYALTNANGAQDSVTLLPANAVVLDVMLDITTPYSPGATLTVGRASNATLLMATTDSLPQVAGIYEVSQDTSWGGTAGAVRTTVAGAPAAGAGFCVIRYSVADA